MQQSIPDDGDRPLLIMFSGIEVAGYYEQGRWIPVTFGQYVRLSKEAKAGSLDYLQPVNGFAGFDWHQSPFGPDIVLPLFLPKIGQAIPQEVKH